MSQKEYSDKGHLIRGIKEVIRDLHPLLKRVINPVKHYLTAHPKKTAIVMFSILLLNTFFLFIIIHYRSASKQAPTYSSIIKNIKNKNSLFDVKRTENQTGLGSFIEIKNIRDSLEYLMHKKVQTKEDTLCFIRLYKRYSLIDPSIMSALKELKKKKADSLHLNH